MPRRSAAAATSRGEEIFSLPRSSSANIMTPSWIVLESVCNGPPKESGERMCLEPLPQASLQFTPPIPLRLLRALQTRQEAAKEPQLDDVFSEAKLEEGHIPFLLAGLELGGNWALRTPAARLLDTLQDAIRPTVEAVSRDKHSAEPLVRALVVELVDPAANLLFGIEVVSKLDAIDELLLYGLVDRFDLAAGLWMLGCGKDVVNVVRLQEAIEASDAAPGVEGGAAVSEHRLGLPVAADRILQERNGVLHALVL